VLYRINWEMSYISKRFCR